MGIVLCENAMDERMLAVPSIQVKYILVEELIKYIVSKIFGKHTAKNKAFVHVTRVLILMKMIIR